MFNKKFGGSVGFSLFEMMVALGVVSVLISFAYPVYNKYKVKARIVEVAEALAVIQRHMESYYQENQSYINDVPEPSSSACGAINIAALRSRYFDFQCVSVDLDGYLWEASNKASVGLGDADTFKYTINEIGEKTTTAYPDLGDTAPCWLLYKSTC